jgi:hypothetical protein
VQSNDKLIVDGVANLAMKPGATTRDLLNRITNTMFIIKVSCNSYQKKNANLTVSKLEVLLTTWLPPTITIEWIIYSTTSKLRFSWQHFQENYAAS